MYLELDRNTSAEKHIEDDNFEVKNAYYIASIAPMLINHFIKPEFVTDLKQSFSPSITHI